MYFHLARNRGANDIVHLLYCTPRHWLADYVVVRGVKGVRNFNRATYPLVRVLIRYAHENISFARTAFSMVSLEQRLKI